MLMVKLVLTSMGRRCLCWHI